MIGFTSIGYLVKMDLSHRDVQHFLLSEQIHPAAFVGITEGSEVRLDEFNPPINIRANFKSTGSFEDFVHEYADYLLNAGKYIVLASMVKTYLERKQDIIFFSTDEELQLGYLEALAEVIKRRYGIYVMNPNELLQYYIQPPNMSEYTLGHLY